MPESTGGWGKRVEHVSGRALDALEAAPAMLQARTVMSHIPRLPEAAGPTEGEVDPLDAPGAPVADAGGGADARGATEAGGAADARGATEAGGAADTPCGAYRVLVVGESPAAGVGVEDHRDGIAARLGADLATRLRRRVHWRAHGRNGATLARIRYRLVPEIADEPADLVVLLAGVNDTIRGTDPREWSAHLDAVLQALASGRDGRIVAVPGTPPFTQFPALPRPLSDVLARRAHRLDEMTQVSCDRWTARYVAFPRRLFLDPAAIATDGFHPSAAGYQQWATMIAQVVAPQPSSS